MKTSNPGSTIQTKKVVTTIGWIITAKKIWQRSISPDVQGAEGETALQIAATNGYLNIAKLLIKKGATIDLPNNYGWTPLMHAARHGNSEIVSLLIQMKAKINVNNRLGLRPIDLAAWSGNLSCLNLIMDAGAVIDNDKSLSVVQTDICDISPLIAASFQGHDFVVKTLLEKGSDVNQSSPVTGLTPLILAACNGYKSTVEILIEFGGNANVTDICGRTALDLASIENKEDVIIFLEDLTQPNSRKSSGGITNDVSILRVIRNGDVGEVKSLLQLNQGLSNYSDPDDGVTPLMIASMLGYNNIVDTLISYGADLNAQDITNGWTPLMYAVFHRQTETVKFLLDKGVDIDICTANGYTALDLAIHTDTTENNILNTLLAYSESEELLDTPDNAIDSTCSTVKQNQLAVEKTYSRADSQPRFKELFGSFSSHLRQFSRSSVVSPTPDTEIYDETLYDVFDDDITETPTEKNFLCLSKFYAPNQRFAHLIKEQVVEAICLPPLPSPKNTMNLVKLVCLKKEKINKNIPAKPYFNSLHVPNLLGKMKRNSLVHSSHIPGGSLLSESLNVQDIAGFPPKSNSLLKIKESDLNKCEDETTKGGLIALLSDRSLGRYAKKFQDQEIDLECFKYLTEDDLDEMGINSFNSRNKLMKIIDNLKNS